MSSGTPASGGTQGKAGLPTCAPSGVGRYGARPVSTCLRTGQASLLFGKHGICGKRTSIRVGRWCAPPSTTNSLNLSHPAAAQAWVALGLWLALWGTEVGPAGPSHQCKAHHMTMPREQTSEAGDARRCVTTCDQLARRGQVLCGTLPACLCAVRHPMRPAAGLRPGRGVETDAKSSTHTTRASAADERGGGGGGAPLAPRRRACRPRRWRRAWPGRPAAGRGQSPAEECVLSFTSDGAISGKQMINPDDSQSSSLRTWHAVKLSAVARNPTLALTLCGDSPRPWPPRRRAQQGPA